MSESVIDHLWSDHDHGDQLIPIQDLMINNEWKNTGPVDIDFFLRNDL